MATEGMIDLKIRLVPDQNRHVIRVNNQMFVADLCHLVERDLSNADNHDGKFRFVFIDS